MDDKLAMALAQQSRRDPIREYLSDQSVQAYGDAGANMGKGGLSGGIALSMGSPIAAALLSAGFGVKAVQDVLRAVEMAGGAEAFGKTGLPGAPMGGAPLIDPPHQQDHRVGRFAQPQLMGGQ